MTFVSNTPTPASTVIDYSSRDYSSIYADLVARIPNFLPEWTSQSQSDFGLVLLQMFSYVGDILGYYLDRLAGEAFLQTATQPASVINLAQMLGYTPTLSVGSTGQVVFTMSNTFGAGNYPYTIPAGTIVSTAASSSSAIMFQLTESLTIPNPLATNSALSSSLVAGITYQNLTVTTLAESVFTGDYLTLISNTATPGTMTVVVADNTAVAGSTNINVLSFTPSVNFPTGSTVDFPGQGIVNVVQGVTQSNEQVATSNGSVNQIYQLGFSPVSAGSCQVFVDLGLGPQPWTFVQTLINSGPTDLVFTSFVDANENFYVVFGDGVNGYVPPLGSPITATYMTNDGSEGNVGVGQINQMVTALVGVASVTNPVATNGGADPESLVSIQQNAPASLQTLSRAVTVNDFSTLGLQVAGVEWAQAQQVTYQLVNLYVAPFGGGQPSQALLNEVNAYVQPLAMANTTITMFGPTYVPINVTASITLFQNYGITTTQQAIISALSSLLSFDTTGFGFRVTLGLVYQAILGVPGVNYCSVTGLTRQTLSTLTVALSSGSTYTTLSVSTLPQEINSGDSLTLTSGANTQSGIIAATVAPQGSTSIAVNSFVANFSYPTSTAVQDAVQTQIQDAILLPNEIPTPGTFLLTVIGGIAGS